MTMELSSVCTASLIGEEVVRHTCTISWPPHTSYQVLHAEFPNDCVTEKTTSQGEKTFCFNHNHMPVVPLIMKYAKIRDLHQPDELKKFFSTNIETIEKCKLAASCHLNGVEDHLKPHLENMIHEDTLLIARLTRLKQNLTSPTHKDAYTATVTPLDPKYLSLFNTFAIGLYIQKKDATPLYCHAIHANMDSVKERKQRFLNREYTKTEYVSFLENQITNIPRCILCSLSQQLNPQDPKHAMPSSYAALFVNFDSNYPQFATYINKIFQQAVRHDRVLLETVTDLFEEATF